MYLLFYGLYIGVTLILIGYGQKNEKISNFKENKTSIIIIDLSKEKTNYFNYYLISGMLFIASSVLFSNNIFKEKPTVKEKKETVDLLEKLTNQEKKVVHLINQTKSNKEIAAQLAISLSTLKTHINNIYKKLDIKSRAELLNSLKNKGTSTKINP
ncbi:response regulator transcription factor [Tenacibaculum finnmarkense]|uniref:response regulator transcription factor n=1 Tax=Tenacibaculum finnmarkense TaxID=2781243 RepID=UPI001FB185CC|nr:LuxR C-terminal-related transcriptional regulator [Tenacibaculum finnmarkense]